MEKVIISLNLEQQQEKKGVCSFLRGEKNIFEIEMTCEIYTYKYQCM